MLTVRELFKVGRGPSSSHTIGPMRAAKHILDLYESKDIKNIKVIFYGSFALTGKGHLTDKGVKEVFAKYPVEFVWDIKTPTPHPNTMDVYVYGQSNKEIGYKRFVSIGGGTICVAGEPPQKNIYPFKNFAEIKQEIIKKKLSCFGFLCKYEKAKDLVNLYDEMIVSFEQTIKQALKLKDKIDGKYDYDRRAHVVWESIKSKDTEFEKRMKKVSAYAIATSEQSMNYGLVVTAPTCGSCGVMPAVYMYMKEKYKLNKQRLYEAFSAAALFGITIKQNGSVAGATGGCQAEIGVATCMAAAMYSSYAYNSGICEIEKAGEAALQHIIGLTCDAVKGSVFVPCIQRNAIYANKAIDAAILAHYMKKLPQLIYMDETIEAAYISGNELDEGYRETALLGLGKYAQYSVPEKKKK